MPAILSISSIDEDDALLFRAGKRLGLHAVVVDEFLRFLVDDLLHRLTHADLALFALFGEHFAEDGADVDLRTAGHEFHALGRVEHLDLDDRIVEFTRAQIFAQFCVKDLFCELAALGLFLFGEHGEDLFLSDLARPHGDFLHLFLAHEADGALDEVSHHALDVAADVTDLGVLGRLHLDEGRANELCKPARDLRLAHARGPLHDDVLGRDLVAVRFGEHAPAVAVAQRNGHGAFCLVLPDDIFV